MNDSLPLSPFARVAFGLALASLACLLVAGPGFQSNLWNLHTGFTVFQWGAYLGLGALAVSLVGLFDTRPGGQRRGMGWAVAGLMTSVITLSIALYWWQRAQQVPPIHDITTDMDNPPEFVAILPLREGALNPAEYGGPEVAAQQRQGYPNIEPLYLQRPKDEVFQQALSTVRDLGWTLVAADPTAGRIEATDTTFWFGFKDDIVIRVTETANGTRVDVRSVSRVGRSDVGTNAARIDDFLDQLQHSD